MADCAKCIHEKACQAWIRHGETLYDDFECSVVGCPYFVDAVPVVHGRWEKRTDVVGFVRCSNCRDCNIYDDWADGEKWNYCPNCGAKMDGDVDG